MKWQGYSDKYYNNPNAILLKENDYLNKLIKKHDPQGKRCLDLGCGLGYWTKVFYDYKADVKGVDISEEAIEQCRKKYPDIHFFLMSDSEEAFWKERYDIILISWVLQEINEDSVFLELLENTLKALSSNGVLIIVDNLYPDTRTLIRKGDLGDIFSNDSTPSQLRFFSESCLSEVLRKYQMRLINNTVVGHSFFQTFELDQPPKGFSIH